MRNITVLEKAALYNKVKGDGTRPTDDVERDFLDALYCARYEWSVDSKNPCWPKGASEDQVESEAAEMGVPPLAWTATHLRLHAEWYRRRESEIAQSTDQEKPKPMSLRRKIVGGIESLEQFNGTSWVKVPVVEDYSGC